MKPFSLALFWLCLSAFPSFSQNSMAIEDPIAFLSGQWIQKTTSIEPAPEHSDWKSQVVLNEFEPILKGKGLHRTITTDGGMVVEGYFFYDSVTRKLYGMSVDENGYVWQTESVLDGEGNATGNKGGPINDPSVSMLSELEVVDHNEVRFTQTWADPSGTTIMKGVFIRVPFTSSN